ncbi:M15 family metallopeptidase [Dyadobacter subterraneus]|uniref:D-alanyl-D-alanine dipeptidase n=1 Tax=Dyadobacter subterraneus TaxID=2773304 RepID=A0ABR9W4Y0_9BACT|nr:M15 family metallopeptidase [Dyadobacter subterraneus]MBE9460513.1 M15 family metallopeptidase [Dyadobacter subterraneus]
MQVYKVLLGIFIFSIPFSVSAQKKQSDKISPVEQKILDQGLVNIQTVNPEILVELKYATPDNFMKKNVYGELTHAYLQPEMAKRLSQASIFIQRENPGYQLLVYDAARPNSAQYKLWDALDDLKIPARSKTQYVADPKIGSNHNFGCAIDLTVVDQNGKPLDMGTPYDFFGPLAYPRSEQEMLTQGKLTSKQIANRNILRKAMVKAGFTVNTTEWWHFDGMSKKAARAKYGMIK